MKHDSDEWLRKAAEDYPIQPIGMNWDSVAERITEEAPVKAKHAYVIFRYAAMILFFMLLSLVCNKYLRLDFDKRYAASSILFANTGKENSLLNKSQLEPIVKNIVSVTNTLERSKHLFTKEKQLGTNQLSFNRDVQETKATELKINREVETPVDNTDNIHTTTPDLPKISSQNSGVELTATIPNVDEGKVEASTKKQEKKGLSQKKRLYAGLVIGPDASTVKMQKIEGLGYNAGLFMGYQLSSKWQIETGFLLNRKAYYSDGGYFHEEKTYLPQHASIKNVAGYCNMFEIPLNVRYNFHQKKGHQWFAVTGISSYLMTKEKYDYLYVQYNNEYKGNKVYKNESRDWLSAFNASVGYEHVVGQKIKVRVEPYMKIPLRGMGTGKLPISSSGMNVGISYPLK